MLQTFSQKFLQLFLPAFTLLMAINLQVSFAAFHLAAEFQRATQVQDFPWFKDTPVELFGVITKYVATPGRRIALRTKK